MGMGVRYATLLVRAAFLGFIKVYRAFISPLVPAHCRFAPTCSAYMEQAVQEWGVIRGLCLGSRRLLRCHPWGGAGYDPVPVAVEARVLPQKGSGGGKRE